MDFGEAISHSRKRAYTIESDRNLFIKNLIQRINWETVRKMD